MSTSNTAYTSDRVATKASIANPVFHKRFKRIKIMYHWINEHVGPDGRGRARLVHVEFMNEAADLFTKVLCGQIFEARAGVVVVYQRSKSRTMIDRPKRRRRKDGGGRRKPSP